MNTATKFNNWITRCVFFLNNIAADKKFEIIKAIWETKYESFISGKSLNFFISNGGRTSNVKTLTQEEH